MGQMFSWLQKPADVAQDKWDAFLSIYTGSFVLILAATIVLIVAGYWLSARARKIRTVNDVFLPYKPLLWLLAALLGGITAAMVWDTQYRSVPGVPGAPLGLDALILLLAAVISALIAYLVIAFVPGVTPPKFKYRPAPFLHRS